VRNYITFDEMRQAIADAGFVNVRSRRFALGSVAGHVGVRP
jgi:hypothetical protein